MKLNRKQRRHLASLQRKGVKITMARTEEELKNEMGKLKAQVADLSYEIAALEQARYRVIEQMSKVYQENQDRIKGEANAPTPETTPVSTPSTDAA